MAKSDTRFAGLTVRRSDEEIDHPDRIILGHIVIATFGKQRGLPTACTLTTGSCPNSPDPKAFSHSLSQLRRFSDVANATATGIGAHPPSGLQGSN
jgi:hypothetical protein